MSSGSGLGLYKKGQGYYVRLFSAIAYGLLVFLGADWLADELGTLRLGDIQPVYVQGGAAIVVIAIFGVVGFQLIGRSHRVVDFMIACEGEMKKVNWSTRREVFGSTWVVILLTLFVALFTFACDQLFIVLFSGAGILDQ